MDNQTHQNETEIPLFREHLRKQLQDGLLAADQLNSLLLFYMNYLEQITQDFLDDNYLPVTLFSLYFRCTQNSIIQCREQLDGPIEERMFTLSQMFDFYDKVCDLSKLEIDNDYVIAFAFQYEYIFRNLQPQARKDISDKRENLILCYTATQIKAIKQKLKAIYMKYSIPDITYILLYDLFLPWKKTEVIASQQILDLVDDSVLDYFADTLDQYRNKDSKEMKQELYQFKLYAQKTIWEMRKRSKKPFEKFLRKFLVTNI